MKKKVILLLASFMVANISFAQNLFNAKSPADIGKSNMVENADGKLIEEEDSPMDYAYLDDRDVMWSTTVWEKVVLSEKLNMSYYFPIDTTRIGSDRRCLYDALVRGIKQGTITEVYDDSYFTTRLTQKELSTRTSRIDTMVVGIDMLNEGYEEIPPEYIMNTKLKAESVKEYWIKGVWYFDKRNGEMKYRLLALAPVAEELRNPEKTYDTAPDVFPLFWVWYPDAREVLHGIKVFNPQNTSFSLSYDNLLNARRFSSIIYKKDNVYGDRGISEYVKENAMFQLMEAGRVKSRIREFEMDMWAY
ncbi:MAG: gliding motility protein GldN [Bacteroidales bacterium]|nr:gliding motility protein GldN [Bacteroidales bacterium]